MKEWSTVGLTVTPVRLRTLPTPPMRDVRVFISFLAIFLFMVTAPAYADQFSGGVVVQGETFDPQHPDARPSYKTLYSNAGVIISSLQRAWYQKSDDICTTLKDGLVKADSLGKGYTPYDITCSMGDASKIKVAATSITDGIHLTITVPGNYLEFTTTQPTACGRECDPRFSFAYDASIGMDVQASGTNLKVANVAVQVQNPNVDSHNAAADIVKAVVNALYGSQFLNNLAGRISYRGADLANKVNGNLSVLNALLGGLAQQGGYQHLAVNLAGSQIANVPPVSVLLQLSRDTFNIPVTGSGQISGAIRWDSAAGNPASCASMGVVAKAAIGYRQNQQFVAPQTVVGRTVSTGPRQTGGVSECGYEITDLPYNIPLEIDATANGPWNGSAAYDVKIPRPDGWIGHVTIEQPTGIAVQKSQVPVLAGSAANVQINTSGQSSSFKAPQSQPILASSQAALQITQPAGHKGSPKAAPPRQMGTPVQAAPPTRSNAPLRATFIATTQSNPHGPGSVNGIDFAIQFQQAPR